MIELEEWRDIPLDFYYNYQVSNLGNVRVRCNKNIYEELKGYTTHLGYRNVKLKYIDGQRHCYFIHRLVALAFIPLPEEGNFQKKFNLFRDGVPYLVNHIDRNRSNNHVSNLEWCDYKHNSNHSYDDIYLNKALSCILRNIETEEEILFKTSKDLANYLNTSIGSICSLVSLHKEIPYLGKYLFLTDNYYNKKCTHKHDIICKDYLDDKIFIVDSIKELATLTGLNVGSIRNRITGTYYKNKLNMTAGYVFMLLKDHNGIWPEYDKREAEISRKTYLDRWSQGINKTNKEIVCKDYFTGETYEFESIIKGSEYFNYKDGLLEANISRNDFKLFDGKIFMFKYDDRDWPEFSQYEIQRSRELKYLYDKGIHGISNGKPIIAKNLETGEIKRFLSITDAGKYIPADRKTLGIILNHQGKQKPYKNWILEYETEENQQIAA